MEIAKLLLNTQFSIGVDKTIFQKWENNEITIEEAIERFKKNNCVKEEVEIDQDEFIAWMNSIGWGRK